MRFSLAFFLLMITVGCSQMMFSNFYPIVITNENSNLQLVLSCEKMTFPLNSALFYNGFYTKPHILIKDENDCVLFEFSTDEILALKKDNGGLSDISICFLIRDNQLYVYEDRPHAQDKIYAHIASMSSNKCVHYSMDMCKAEPFNELFVSLYYRTFRAEK